MPVLPLAQQEAFAQLRASGIAQTAAYEQAGYAGGGSNGSKLAAKPHVAARIAELTEMRGLVNRADLANSVADLMAWADKCVTLNTAAGMKEARLTRLDANRLYDELGKQERRNRPLEPELTLEEWMAKYGAKAPG